MQYLCYSIAMCNICLCKKWFEAYVQKIINSVSLKNENKNSEDDSGDSDNLQEHHDSDDDGTVDGDFFPSKNNQNNHVYSSDIDGFIGIFDPTDVEPDDISEENSQKYIAIGVVEEKEKWNFPNY